MTYEVHRYDTDQVSIHDMIGSDVQLLLHILNNNKSQMKQES